jgi:FkbM family methyltransferase
MRLSPRQRASWLAHLFKSVTQQHHRELLPLFEPYVGPDAVVVDIGAHAGQFAKLFARMAPRGHVYAFEPSEYARSILAPAVRLNGFRNITMIAKGLAREPGSLELQTPLKRTGALGYGMAHLGGGETGPSVSQTVPLTTLDAFAEETGLARLDFIKADIEGWELQALKGGEGALRRFRPALFVEVNNAFLGRAGDSAADLFAFLQGLGYRAFEAPPLKPVTAYGRSGDYLFVPD